MGMREKLIELQKMCCKGEKPCVDDCFACMADHLIANGVTIPVRCKDCKFALDHPTDSQKLVCTKSVNWRAVEPEHYCSYGERRTDE